MPLEDSILKSTKKNLGLGADYTDFDLDVITNINNAFFSLYQLGVGPSEGFTVEDDDQLWSEFIAVSGVTLGAVKTYVFLKVKSVFDPPGTPHHIQALKEQITELEHRLLIERNLPHPLPNPLELATLRTKVFGGDLDD